MPIGLNPVLRSSAMAGFGVIADVRTAGCAARIDHHGVYRCHVREQGILHSSIVIFEHTQLLPIIRVDILHTHTECSIAMELSILHIVLRDLTRAQQPGHFGINFPQSACQPSKHPAIAAPQYNDLSFMPTYVHVQCTYALPARPPKKKGRQTADEPCTSTLDYN